LFVHDVVNHNDTSTTTPGTQQIHYVHNVNEHLVL